MADKKKLLLVEDEEALVELMKVRLETNDYEVMVAGDGQQGLEMARQYRPDLIVLDLMLPRMNGYEVCALLKQDKNYSNIPILIFTARAQENDKKLALDVGADDYIVKPFEPPALLAKIDKLLKKGQ